MSIMATLFCIVGIYIQYWLKKKSNVKHNYKVLFSFGLCFFVGSSMRTMLSGRNSLLILSLVIIIPIYFYLFISTLMSKTNN